ncbi:MAG: hypothetical protein LBH06_06550 [Rikenellaceae bacterium]|nr:hypothetical protein [Rikenellaceae bacterium]
MNDKDFDQAVGQGFLSGLIGGASGALIGGVVGGTRAVIGGRRFWDGAKVEKIIVANNNMPSVKQVGDNNCLPASAESIDRSFGGAADQSTIREWVAPGSDSNTDPLGDVDTWTAYSKIQDMPTAARM